MTDLVDLAPSNTTPLERASIRTVDSYSRYASLVHAIVDVRYQDVIPEDILPWLLRHWGLEDAAEFMADHQRLYKEGKRWQTLRGRVAAYPIIFDWLGLDGVYEIGHHGDVRWGLFQIGLEEAPDRETLRNLIGLANLSKRASAVLGRIHNGYDIRPFRFDQSRFDDAILDDWSGIYLDGIAPKLSFGSVYGGVVGFDMSVLGGATGWLEGTARFEEGFILDRSMLDNEVLEPSVVSIQAALLGESIGLADDQMIPWPNMRWPAVTWAELETITIYGGPDGPVS